VLVPERVKELRFREFLIVIARAGGQFIAVGRDRSGMQVARAHGSAIDEVEADLKSKLLKLPMTSLMCPVQSTSSDERILRRLPQRVL